MENKLKVLDLIPIPLIKESEAFLKERKELSKQLAEISSGYISMDVIAVESGNVSIESFYDEAINTISILKTIRSIEKEKYDAIIIDCMGDPALDAAREITEIPVLGAMESSAFLASIIGDKFGIIGLAVTEENKLDSLYTFNLRKYGLENKLVGISYVTLSVLDIEKDRERTFQEVLSAIKDLEKMGAKAAIIGCTGLESLVSDLKKHTKLEIIDPLLAAIGLAFQIKITDTHFSRRVWATPPKKEFIGGKIWLD